MFPFRSGFFNLFMSKANLHYPYNSPGCSHCTLQKHHEYIIHHHRDSLTRGPGTWQQIGWPGFDPRYWRGGDFSSLLRVQTVLGVHSTSYKMSTEGFTWGKGGQAQDQPLYLFLVSWLCMCGPFHPHPPWAFMVCKGDSFTFTIIRVFCPRAGLSLQTQAPRLQLCSKAGLPPQTQEPVLQFYTRDEQVRQLPVPFRIPLSSI